MSATFDAVGPGSSGIGGQNVTSLSWTHTPSGTPTGVAVTVGWWGTASDFDISGITYGGASMAKAAEVGPLGDFFNAIYDLASPASGAKTVVVSFTGGSYPAAASISVIGGDTSTCISGVSTGNHIASGSSIADASFVSGVNDLVLDILQVNYSVKYETITPGSGQTQRWVCNNGAFTTAGGSTHAGGTVAMSESWPDSVDRVCIILSAAFKAAGVVAARRAATLLMMGCG